MKTHPAILTYVLASGMIVAAPARGQGISAGDQREAARFDVIVRAATQAGYAQPIVVGHGDSTTDALFALLATRNGSGVLIAVSEPTGSAPAQPIELERDRTPAQLGIRGIQFTVFLGDSDLYDLVVNHEPFMLETSRRFETHHVLRRRGTRLESACEFPGSDASSSSKGMGSVSGSRRVTVERVSGGVTLRFLVRTVDETTERSSRQAAPVSTSHSESTKEYELPATGPCHER
jgi:hypothetical protein